MYTYVCSFSSSGIVYDCILWYKVLGRIGIIYVFLYHYCIHVIINSYNKHVSREKWRKRKCRNILCEIRLYCTEHSCDKWLGTLLKLMLHRAHLNTLCISCYLAADQYGWVKEKEALSVNIVLNINKLIEITERVDTNDIIFKFSGNAFRWMFYSEWFTICLDFFYLR